MLIQTVGGPTDRIAGIDSTYIHAWAESQQTENPRGMWIRYRLDRMDKHGAPDLSDPATLGCLLALVREAWGRRMLVAYYAPLTTGQGWYVGDRFCGGRDYPIVEAPSATEAAALVAALEAAP